MIFVVASFWRVWIRAWINTCGRDLRISTWIKSSLGRSIRHGSWVWSHASGVLACGVLASGVLASGILASGILASRVLARLRKGPWSCRLTSRVVARRIGRVWRWTLIWPHGRICLVR